MSGGRPEDAQRQPRFTGAQGTVSPSIASG